MKQPLKIISRIFARYGVCIIFILMINNMSFSQENTELSDASSTVDYNGSILDGDIPVAFATVVLKELGADVLTDESGNFSFVGVPLGAYTLLVIAEGFEDREFSITITQESVIFQEFQLSDARTEEVYQEDVTISANRLKNSDGGQRKISKEDIDRLPLKGDDPITLFEQDTGVIEQRTTRNPAAAGNRGQIYSRNKEFTVYGSEAGWNRYFYGNIQIPTNNHIANPNTSIITRKAVNSIDIYKGSPSGIYGPGLGGTVVLNPRKDPDSYLLLGLSPTDPSATFSFWFTENLSLFISARYATFQYTVLPFIQLYSDSNPDLTVNTDRYAYADAIISLEYVKGNHDVAVLALGFYDDIVLDASINVPANSGRGARAVDADIVSFPIYGATGLSWELLLGDNAKNTLATYFSVYNTAANTAVDIDEGEALRLNYSYKGFVRTINYTVLDHYEWFLQDNMILTFGIEFTYLNMVGKHEEIFKLEQETQAFLVNTSTPTYHVDEQVYKIYEFTDFSWNFSKLETSSTLGLTQVVTDEGFTIDQIYPSARELVSYSFNNYWKLSLMTSWSPSFLEGSTYIDRLLSEERASYDNRTKYIHPTYGITTVPKLTWQINEKNAVFLEPYFAYYYHFSGMHSGLIVNNDRESQSGYLYITPNQGIGVGSAIVWNWTPEYHKYDISYTLGYAMYDTEDYGWLPPENDYRHQLKTSYTFSRIKQFQIGISGYILFDKPFTPTQMVQNTSLTGSLLIEENVYPYSARSYIPEYELYINFKGTIIDRPRWDFTYRFQPGNLLGMFVFTGNEIKDKSYIGATNADIDNRTLDFNFIPINILQNLFLSFEVTIDFPRL